MTAGGDYELDLEDLLNPDEQLRFRRLCITTSPEELGQLSDSVELHLDQVRAYALPATDIETAETLAAALKRLLASSRDLPDADRAMVRGAVEYFLLNEDASGDLEDVLGFDDDVRVLNTVLDRIGRPELKVELPG